MEVLLLTIKIDGDNKRVRTLIQSSGVYRVEYKDREISGRNADEDILKILEDTSTRIEEDCGTIVSVVRTDKIISGEMFKEVTTYQFLVFVRKKAAPVLSKAKR